MAISGIINSPSSADVANFLNSHFGDKLNAVSRGSGILDVYIDNHKIMSFSILAGNGMYDYIYNSSGTCISNTNSSSISCRISIISASNGFIIESKNEYKHALYFLTFNSDGTIIYGGTNTSDRTSYAFSSFVTTTWNTEKINTTVTSVLATSTALVNFVYAGNFGENSISEKGYFSLYSQYPNLYGIATINNKNYIFFGCFYIAD